MKIKVLLLILANILAAIIVLYFLDVFNINDSYKKLMKKLPMSAKNIVEPRYEDLDLIEKEEQEKLLISITLKEEEFKKRELVLQEREEKIIKDIADLKIEKQTLLKQKQQLELAKKDQESYEKKIATLASQYSSMDPKIAVPIILKLDDDLLILDVLKEMDKQFAAKGKASVVPYFYSLMPPDDASRLQRKSTISE